MEKGTCENNDFPIRDRPDDEIDFKNSGKDSRVSRLSNERPRKLSVKEIPQKSFALVCSTRVSDRPIIWIDAKYR
jgi:hypothetical protein